MSDTTSTSDSSNTMDKRRKSLSQSIRAKLTRSHSSEVCRSPNSASDSGGSSAWDTPPIPPIPRCHSMNAVSPSNSIPSTTAVSKEELSAAWTSITPPPFPATQQYTACYCEENVYLLTQHLSASLTAINTSALNIARQQSKHQKRPPLSTQRSVFVPVWDLHVAFISNTTKTVLLYQQSASKLPSAGSPVIWDYHVIAIATCHLIPLNELSLDRDGLLKAPVEANCKSWVYDYDTLLSNPPPSPVPWDEYNAHTFHPQAIASNSIPAHFQPLFRCIPANDFLTYFASDRRHMLIITSSKGQMWSAEPPKWDVIVGSGAKKDGCKSNLMEKYVDVGADSGARYGEVWKAREWLVRGGPPMKVGLGGSLVDDGCSDVALQGATEVKVVEEKVSIRPVVDEKRGMPQTAEGGGEEETKGGRITSPLFPAYLHSSQQHRAANPRPASTM